jgi:histone deacetylase 11
VPEEITAAQVRLVHTQGFVDSLADSSAVARYLEVAPLAALPNGLVDAGVTAAFRRCSGGTLLAGRLALRHGIAVNVGGGYHHARPAAGEGFCIYNDLAIAVRTLQDERLIRRAMVVDLDVHQGNGTATCFAGDDAVFLLDMYQDSIYPQPKVPVDMAIPLRAGTDGREYLRLLRNQLPEALWQGRPDIVFIQGGADVLAGDQLGGLKLTPQELVDRDAVVIDACRAADIPVVLTLGGGYQQDAWRAQAASIRRTVLTHGTPDGQPPHRPRKPTGKEKYFTR